MVVITPEVDSLSVRGGVLGQYVATVIVPARTDTLPDEGTYWWGHVLTVVGKTPKRCSLMDAVSQWAGISDRRLGGIGWKADIQDNPV